MAEPLDPPRTEASAIASTGQLLETFDDVFPPSDVSCDASPTPEVFVEAGSQRMLGEISIVLVNLAGVRVAELIVPTCMKIRELRKEVRDVAGVPVHRVKLLNRGEELGDDASVHECDITDGAELVLLQLRREVQNFRSAVRIRPLHSFEVHKNCSQVVQAILTNRPCSHQGIVTLSNLTEEEHPKVKEFAYDAIFDETHTQQDVFDEVGLELVEKVLEGCHSTIFAFGATGAGKSHTIVGGADDPGLLVRSYRCLFAGIEQDRCKSWRVRCSYVVIYNEEFFDMLSEKVEERSALVLKPPRECGHLDPPQLHGVTRPEVKTMDELQAFLALGSENLRTLSANCPLDRCHTIVSIAATRDEGDGQVRVGKLNLVDLAGSERRSRVGMSGGALKEETKINFSLSALGNVISARVNVDAKYVPYRDSKLTRLLQESLSGHAYVVLIAHVTPTDRMFEETFSTLRFASRVTGATGTGQRARRDVVNRHADRLRQLEGDGFVGGEEIRRRDDQTA
mmetsp:Transcript_80811/g.224880  ORF Transcript_80811/g.224880 Transcript_80811/m.224880 type:complete len:511 (-) Transcript_80811:180-1712(-)|eukprot:CAMPEP_0117569426 /NCGR_PEP_ID=MMETSP0784-20121206/58651_1 /TAXON_ID=39447 /ORGANISM="" /LENGTH=510 /DNA_ID=CAMNT_0005367397 /DNA_START=24 /DNA_END=1556 /DNA_ORIENTATION=-